MANYVRDISAKLRPITLEELAEYRDTIAEAVNNDNEEIRETSIDYIAVYDEGFVRYLEVNPPDEDGQSEDIINSGRENDESYDDDEDDYDEDYDYENDYDDDYSYESYREQSAVTVFIGDVSREALRGKENGDLFEIDGCDFLVLDKEKGKIAIYPPETFRMSHYSSDEYLDSYLELACEAIEEKIGGTLPLRTDDLLLNEELAEKYSLSEMDYNKGSAFNQIITGETGCGKTYKAINDEIDSSRKFAYVAPCRQLTYESFRYYADINEDRLSSGEVRINDGKNGNFFGVFESLTPDMIKDGDFDTIIIDEAHFAKDLERGPHLLSLISAAREADVNIKLLTATQNFSLNDFEEINLPARFKVPEKVEIDKDRAIENIKQGMQTIWFVHSINDTEYVADWLCDQGIEARAMNSAATPSERMEIQIGFENKDIQVVVSTNVLAQGVNFECENLIIETDDWNTRELLQQKLGRLGRPGTLKDKNEVYYCTEETIKKVQKDKNITKIKKSKERRDHIDEALERCIELAEEGFTIKYNDVKYCIPEFMKYAETLEGNYIHDRIRDEKDALLSKKDSLEELSKITKENCRLHSGCRENAMQETLSWLQGDTEDVESYHLKNALETLRSGSLKIPEDMGKITKNRNHTKITLPLVDELSTKEAQERINDKIAEIDKAIGYIDTPEHRQQVKQDIETYYRDTIESVDDCVEMIRAEQDKLKSLIINNMRQVVKLEPQADINSAPQTNIREAYKQQMHASVMGFGSESSHAPLNRQGLSQK